MITCCYYFIMWCSNNDVGIILRATRHFYRSTQSVRYGNVGKKTTREVVVVGRRKMYFVSIQKIIIIICTCREMSNPVSFTSFHWQILSVRCTEHQSRQNFKIHKTIKKKYNFFDSDTILYKCTVCVLSFFILDRGAYHTYYTLGFDHIRTMNEFLHSLGTNGTIFIQRAKI